MQSSHSLYFEAFVWGTAPYTYHGSSYILIVGLQLVVDNLIRCFSSELTAPSIMALPDCRAADEWCFISALALISAWVDSLSPQLPYQQATNSPYQSFPS